MSLNDIKWPLIGLSIFGTVVAAYLILERQTVVFLEGDKGEPKGYLEPAVVHAGDEVQVCYPHIRWYDVWASEATHWFECPKRSIKGLQLTRFDLPNRTIRVPNEAQNLPPKCRPIGKDDDTSIPVPSWCEIGQLRYGGFITVKRFGFWKLIVNFPTNMTAEIQPKL